MLASFAADLRFAVRVLRKSPLVTTVAVLCIALGSGAVTSIYAPDSRFPKCDCRVGRGFARVSRPLFPHFIGVDGNLTAYRKILTAPVRD
jgi:hypothetical protein